MENVIAKIDQRQVFSIKIACLCLAIVLGLYYYGPKLGNLNILSPQEQEVHGYLKQIIPAVRSTLQTSEKLKNDPTDGTLAADLEKLSDEILTINENYWEKGKRSESFVRILIKKVQGSQDKYFFLPHWKGPDEEPEPLWDMRIDTRTLIVRTWIIKEDSHILAKEVKDLLRERAPKGENSTQEFNALVQTCWRSLGDVDQVYRRWKGSFRSPIHFSARGEKSKTGI